MVVVQTDAPVPRGVFFAADWVIAPLVKYIYCYHA